MYWYNFVSMFWLLVGIILLISITLYRRQYKKGKRGEGVAFLLLASMSTFVGIGSRTSVALIFYLLSYILVCIAVVLILKAYKKDRYGT
ncbi:hypothetical protein ACIQ57_16290 [Lysinibacillus xylanilyticus]|uniref:hypothetical protein n=1 Tax=Lysinibacillus xylanilyticus TaxID=582475 RepID=UPI00381D23FA